MWDELGISGGTAIIILIAFYFVVKWAVKNGVNESIMGQSLLKKTLTKIVRNKVARIILFMQLPEENYNRQ